MARSVPVWRWRRARRLLWRRVQGRNQNCRQDFRRPHGRRVPSWRPEQAGVPSDALCSNARRVRLHVKADAGPQDSTQDYEPLQRVHAGGRQAGDVRTGKRNGGSRSRRGVAGGGGASARHHDFCPRKAVVEHGNGVVAQPKLDVWAAVPANSRGCQPDAAPRFRRSQLKSVGCDRLRQHDERATVLCHVVRRASSRNVPPRLGTKCAQ